MWRGVKDMADSLSAKKDLEFDSSTKQQSGPLRRVVEREQQRGMSRNARNWARKGQEL